MIPVTAGMTRIQRALFHLGVPAVLVACAPLRLAAQAVAAPAASARNLLLEHRFGADSAERAVVTLKHGVVYRAEVEGTGTLVIEHMRRGAPPAFLVPIAGSDTGDRRSYEVYPVRGGEHVAFLSGLAPGAVATLRLYHDVALTREIEERHDRGVMIGFQVDAGRHSGYRLDPTGGADPRGGGDVEGCVLADAADRFGTCIGIGRQAFPDAGYSVTWAFAEERVRVVAGQLIAGRRTDLGVSVRFSRMFAAGPRNIRADLLSLGLYVTQHLAGDGMRHGWSVVAAWQHGRLGNAPETELLDTDRFTAGLAWIP
jgi:hypothetical protein